MRRPGGGSSWQSQPIRRHPSAEWKPNPRTDGGGIPVGPETASRARRSGREWWVTPVRSTTRRLDPHLDLVVNDTGGLESAPHSQVQTGFLPQETVHVNTFHVSLCQCQFEQGRKGIGQSGGGNSAWRRLEDNL